MAAPVFAASDSTSGVVTTNSTSWTVTWPTNLASGDLVLWIVSSDGGGQTFTFPGSGGVSTSGQEGTTTAAVHKYVADGTESGTATLTLGSSEQGAWYGLRVPAAEWGGTLGTSWGPSVTSSGDVVAAGGWDWGVNGAPDSQGLNLYNTFGVGNWRFGTVGGCDRDATVTAGPSTYEKVDGTSGYETAAAGGANGATVFHAWKDIAINVATPSENPGSWTLSKNEGWNCLTLAVRENTAAGAVTGSADLAMTMTEASTGTITPIGSATIPLLDSIGSTAVITPIGTSDVPETFTFISSGTLGAVGAGSALNLLLDVVSDGQRVALGDASLAMTWGSTSTGTPTVMGSVTLPTSWSIGSSAVITPIGSSTFPMTFTEVSSGTITPVQYADLALTLGQTTTGTPTFVGTSDLPLGITIATTGNTATGSMSYTASASLGITFALDSSGVITPVATSTLPLGLTIVSDSQRTVVTSGSALAATFAIATSSTYYITDTSSLGVAWDAVSSGVITPVGLSTLDLTFDIVSSGTGGAGPTTYLYRTLLYVG